MNCVIRHFDGLQDYVETWQAMQKFTGERKQDTEDEIWLLQHAAVFTLGQASNRQHLLGQTEIPVIQSDRGGQITYHGPGQLIMYTLLDIKRRHSGVRDLVNALEKSLIKLLADYGVQGYAKKEAPGVYVQHNNREQKIAALGLRVKQGRAYHGLSFNVDMDLSPFAQINPCGYAGLAVTQLKDLVDQIPDWQTLENQLSKIFIQSLT